MASRTVALAKRHPGIAMFITVGAIAGAALSIWQLGGVVDKSVITHAEFTDIFSRHETELTGIFADHEVKHVALDDQMTLIRQESKCGSVDIQIAILSEVIWRLEQSEPQGQRLMEKRAELDKLQDRRTALKCAELA